MGVVNKWVGLAELQQNDISFQDKLAGDQKIALLKKLLQSNVPDYPVKLGLKKQGP